MTSRSVYLAALGAISLAACGQPAGSASSAAPPVPAGSPAATATPDSDPRVVVDNETGIQITPAAGGAAVTVPFGTERTQAQAMLVAALGKPSEMMNPDCPWGPATLWDWPSGAAVVVNNELVGWTGNGGDFGYTCIAD